MIEQGWHAASLQTPELRRRQIYRLREIPEQRRELTMITCTSIEELRHHIDHIDSDLVSLLARRGNLVSQVAAFKKTTAEVKAPSMFEDVIAKVRAVAEEYGALAELAEKVYRAMIAAFIEEELSTHAALKMRCRDLITPAAIPAPLQKSRDVGRSKISLISILPAVRRTGLLCKELLTSTISHFLPIRQARCYIG